MIAKPPTSVGFGEAGYNHHRPNSPGRFRFATIAKMSEQIDNYAPGGNALHGRGDNPLSRCLSLDLEVGRNDGRIHALAGVRPDIDTSFTFARQRGLPQALAKLNELAQGTNFLLGHNLIDFDLHHLRAANPHRRLLQLPVVDTLRLNPLAFPRNPYHYLVKHYKDGSLRRGRLGRQDDTGGVPIPHSWPATIPWSSRKPRPGAWTLAEAVALVASPPATSPHTRLTMTTGTGSRLATAAVVRSRLAPHL